MIASMRKPPVKTWHQPGSPPPVDDDMVGGDDSPSKTQVKAHMLALTKLGEELVELPATRLAKVPLPEKLADAIAQARRINAHGGRRRQVQYVGRLMRELSDEELAAVRATMQSFEKGDAASNAKFHLLERWRTRLLDDDAALTEFLQAYPAADAQQLRALIRNARRERDMQKPPAAFRELFQWLKSAMQAGDGAAPNEDVNE
jgi:ribosome-associated protein